MLSLELGTVWLQAAPKDTIGLLQGLVSALLADNKPSEVCLFQKSFYH